jgi:hypothetical protein
MLRDISNISNAFAKGLTYLICNRVRDVNTNVTVGRWLPSQDPTTRAAGVKASGGVKDDR